MKNKEFEKWWSRVWWKYTVRHGPKDCALAAWKAALRAKKKSEDEVRDGWPIW